MAATELTAAFIQEAAFQLGFDLCRLVAVRPGQVHSEYLQQWLTAGCHGEMAYLARTQELRSNPDQLKDLNGRPIGTIVVLGVDYHQGDLPQAMQDDPSRGLIARYAWQQDYHEVLKPLVYALDKEIRGRSGRGGWAKGWVDTGPIVERDWALAAGLTFTGKNCCAIHPGRGSWILLAVLCIPEDGLAELPNSGPPVPLMPPAQVLGGLPWDLDLGTWTLQIDGHSTAQGTCGRCTRCLDACPTDAFRGPLMLDARKCISYWTIEAKGATPRDLRGQFGNRVFGCDICQEVCPWNKDLECTPPRISDLAIRPDWRAPPLLEGFAQGSPYWLSDEAFRDHFRKSPVKRAKRLGMLRNVCTALGNWGSTETIPALEQALSEPSIPVRQHAAWALGQVWIDKGIEAAHSVLQELREHEENADVLAELAPLL